jgi:antitoxin MazE
MVIYINFDFGKRRVIKVRYTHLLAIPPEWIRNMNISKGDELKIEMAEDSSLRITPISTGPARSRGNGCATTQ